VIGRGIGLIAAQDRREGYHAHQEPSVSGRGQVELFIREVAPAVRGAVQKEDSIA
jgi:hypothetical protein